MTEPMLDQLVEDGYFKVENNELTITPKGEALIAFANASDGRLRGKELEEHKEAFEMLLGIQQPEGPVASEAAMKMNERMLANGYPGFATTDATRFLTGDIDGKMNARVVADMIDDGYLAIEDNMLKSTATGEALLAYAQNSEGGLRSHGHDHAHSGSNDNKDVSEGSLKNIDGLLQDRYFTIKNNHLSASSRGSSLIENWRQRGFI